MRQEVVHEAERLNLITEAGTFVIRCLQARAGKVRLLFDSTNGPFEIEIVPARTRRKKQAFRREPRRDRIKPEE